MVYRQVLDQISPKMALQVSDFSLRCCSIQTTTTELKEEKIKNKGKRIDCEKEKCSQEKIRVRDKIFYPRISQESSNFFLIQLLKISLESVGKLNIFLNWWFALKS